MHLIQLLYPSSLDKHSPVFQFHILINKSAPPEHKLPFFNLIKERTQSS